MDTPQKRERERRKREKRIDKLERRRARAESKLAGSQEAAAGGDGAPPALAGDELKPLPRTAPAPLAGQRPTGALS